MKSPNLAKCCLNKGLLVFDLSFFFFLAWKPQSALCATINTQHLWQDTLLKLQHKRWIKTRLDQNGSHKPVNFSPKNNNQGACSETWNRMAKATQTKRRDRKTLLLQSKATQVFPFSLPKATAAGRFCLCRPDPSTVPGVLWFSHHLLGNELGRHEKKTWKESHGRWGRGSFRLHTWAASGSTSADTSQHGGTDVALQLQDERGTDCVAIYQPERVLKGEEGRISEH